MTQPSTPSTSVVSASDNTSNRPSNQPSDQQWWQVTVTCPIALEDSIYYAFDELGAKGTASQTKDSSRIVTAYFPQDQCQLSSLEAFKRELLIAHAQSSITIDWQIIAEEDWAKSWKRHWQPTEVGSKLLINPAWLAPPDTERTILTLDPGSAFGTGAHATTQLCLEALEQQTLTGATLADIGCGSGILSIVALLYGAHQAYAADVDPLAFSSTRSNAQLNGIDPKKIQVEVGSLPEIIAMAQRANALPVDGIVCNILSEIIVGLIIPRLSELAGPKTWGILSGVLTSKAPWVEEHLVAHGWQVSDMAYQDEWCSMTIRLATP
jgi:ribosomal protein L11 methyltransferase